MEIQGKTLVIIPAFNEEGSVGKVVDGVKTHLPQVDALVVNDGSSDLTSKIARSKGAIVLDLPYNLGIGGAMQVGYKYAHEKGYHIAIQVDGDGQHDPREIPKLLHVLEEGKADVVVGSRFIGDSEYKATVMRRLGSLILSRAISMVVGQKLTDPTSGFRAANQRAIQLFSANYPQDYPEPEALVLLHQCGLAMKEVPAKINQRYSGESSITKIRSIYYMVKVLLAIFVDCFKKRPVLKIGG
jgi:glycosyltransferase involved in cell wall biosynthesis